MSRSIEFAVTDAGRALIGSALAKESPIVFYSANVGTGVVADDVDLKDMTAMVAPAAAPVSNGCTVGNKKINDDGECVVTVVYENSSQVNAMYINQVGIYAQLEDGTGSVLFGYLTFGATPTFVCPASTTTMIRRFEFVISFQSGSSLSVTFNPDTLIPKTDTATENASGKLLYTNSDGDIDANILGSAAYLGGKSASEFMQKTSFGTDSNGDIKITI